MRNALPVLALTALTAGALATARAEEPGKQEVRRVVRLHHGAEADHALPDLAALEGDRVTIDDLATLLPGESRSYYTESGREVVVTRGEGERTTLEVAGKTIEIGGEQEELAMLGLPGEGEGKRMIVRRHRQDDDDAEVTADGEGQTIEEDVVIALPHELLGVDAEGEPPVIIEIVDASEGKEERRVVVLRLAEPAEAP